MNSLNTDSPTSTIPNAKTPKSRHGGLLFALLIILILAAVTALNKQAIEDWWRLRQYNPPTAIVQLANQNTMTDYGRKLFYINKPEVASKIDFSKRCLNRDKEQTIVLGCYHGIQNGIYVLRVDDERLDGVEQVTAAHEMLHAAYDRLGSSERAKVDDMLDDYYKNGLKDERIKNVIDLYKKTEPNDLVNEMHSIFGTEISSLPVNLEQYYSQYFTKRSTIVNYANTYRVAFLKLQNQVKDYDSQLTTQKTQIDNLQADLKSQLGVINTRQQAMNSIRSTNPVAYNAIVNDYNRLVREYNQGVSDLQGQIVTYNELVVARNAVAVQEEQLVNALRADVVEVK